MTVDVDLPVPRRVLAIGAHADDIEFGCGATLAKWAAAGTTVHHQILTDGVERARAKLEYTPLAAAFCPAEFTIAQLRHVYEAVWGITLDPRNFHRKATGTPGFLTPTGAATAGDRGRPAQLYRKGPAPVLYPPLLRTSAGEPGW